jgi:hypothetical protein
VHIRGGTICFRASVEVASGEARAICVRVVFHVAGAEEAILSAW